MHSLTAINEELVTKEVFSVLTIQLGYSKFVRKEAVQRPGKSDIHNIFHFLLHC